MRDFLDCIGIIIISIFACIAIFCFGCLSCDTFYHLEKHFNKSEARVLLDNNLVYNGKSYRVEYTNETENLQAPMFSVIIRGKHYWNIEKKAFGKDLKIITTNS